MASESINLAAYSDALVVLATAGVVVPVMRRLGVSPILGFLGAGALLGPRGLGALVPDFPALYWFTVIDAGSISAIADLGVVFLLFLIGLELSFERLLAMRRLVFGLGTAQVLLSTLLLAGAARSLGLSMASSLVFGAALALSSTAIVIEMLSRQGRLASAVGRGGFSVLLAQDLAVIPILLVVSVLAVGEGASLVTTVGVALAQALGSMAVIVLLGRVFLRRLFRLVATLQSPELFMASVLFVIVGAGFVAALFGMSMALGAFVAGLLLSETEYRKSVEAIVEPFKGLLLGLFFFSVGMGIDPAQLRDAPAALIGVMLGVLALKAGVMVPLARLFGFSWAASVELACLLAPGGEFAFVALGAAVAGGVVAQGEAAFAFTVVAAMMALTPGLAHLGRALGQRLVRHAPDSALAEPPPTMAGHAIIIGHGRIGKVVAELLRAKDIAYLAVEQDAALVARDRRGGHAVSFGDAGAPGFLSACGLERAAAVILTAQAPERAERIIEIIRAMRPEIPIIARAADAAHAKKLYALGVSEAVPETIEASLQMAEASLLGLGVPMGHVIAAIHQRRDAFRAELDPRSQVRLRGVGKEPDALR